MNTWYKSAIILFPCRAWKHGVGGGAASASKPSPPPVSHPCFLLSLSFPAPPLFFSLLLSSICSFREFFPQLRRLNGMKEGSWSLLIRANHYRYMVTTYLFVLNPSQDQFYQTGMFFPVMPLTTCLHISYEETDIVHAHMHEFEVRM